MTEDHVEWCEVIAVDQFDGAKVSDELFVCIEGPVRGRRWVKAEDLDSP